MAAFWIAAATVLGSPARATGQAADITEAVATGMAALNAGEVEAYLGQYAPQAHALIAIGEGLEVSVTTFAALLEGLSWQPVPVRARILGGTAIVVLRLDGSMDVPGFGPVEGPWRYAESRSRVGDRWRIEQVELSPLPRTGAAPTTSGSPLRTP